MTSDKSQIKKGEDFLEVAYRDVETEILESIIKIASKELQRRKENKE